MAVAKPPVPPHLRMSNIRWELHNGEIYRVYDTSIATYKRSKKQEEFSKWVPYTERIRYTEKMLLNRLDVFQAPDMPPLEWLPLSVKLKLEKLA